MRILNVILFTVVGVIFVVGSVFGFAYLASTLHSYIGLTVLALMGVALIFLGGTQQGVWAGTGRLENPTKGLYVIEFQTYDQGTKTYVFRLRKLRVQLKIYDTVKKREQWIIDEQDKHTSCWYQHDRFVDEANTVVNWDNGSQELPDDVDIVYIGEKPSNDSTGQLGPVPAPV